MRDSSLFQQRPRARGAVPGSRAAAWFTVAAATLILPGCASASSAVATAQEQARADALRDLAAGRPHVAWIGVVMADSSQLEPVTGLTRVSAGCCRTPERAAYCDAYTAVISQARAEGRLTGMTFADRITSREAMAARFAEEAPLRLRDGVAADVPGGRFRIDAGPAADGQHMAIRLVDLATQERTELRLLGGDEARALFADGGASLWVRDDASHLYVTYDLATAQRLQAFADPDWTR